jgi:starch-binding outer membrane protein, SusD/RagB family
MKTVLIDHILVKFQLRGRTSLIMLLSMVPAAFFFSCEDFLDIDSPKNQISQVEVFKNDEVATSAVVGIYNRMITNGFLAGGAYGLTLFAGLSSDELVNHNNNSIYIELYKNEISLINSNVELRIWGEAYQYIYTANAILEGLSRGSGVSDETRKQLEGEVKFIRAFCYFYLVNLFGEVPLHTSTYYETNSRAFRTSVDDVYNLILQDLNEAETLIGEAYTGNDRVRPNRFAVKAFISRVSLHREDWATAETETSAVINHSDMYNLEDNLNEVFLINSSEAIWQLMPPPKGNTNDGNIFILTTTPTYVSLSNELLSSFESGDNRKTSWTGSITVSDVTYTYPFKYKVKSSNETHEYSVVLRLAEQYLIRSEARVMQDNIQGAISDLNVIRQRAGLSDLPATLTESEVLDAIIQERRVEFFAEWGHRWLDLKRTNRADMVLAIVKGSTWQPTDVLYPIPQSERNNNLNISQNPGY